MTTVHKLVPITDILSGPLPTAMRLSEGTQALLNVAHDAVVASNETAVLKGRVWLAGGCVRDRLLSGYTSLDVMLNDISK